MKVRVNNGTARRAQRQENAVKLMAERSKRSDKDQLARLEARGHGHCKEAKRLRETVTNE